MSSQPPPAIPEAGRSEITLLSLGTGEVGIVTGVSSGPLRNRLLELGIVRGTPIRVVRIAPAGDPLEVVLHGFHLAIRKSEAATVQVTLDSE
ncbi:MAG TPA: ferrous iron transport protein A [Planctomycetota bacterium]|nr:ferrous iron transport protein A [Planctomycetota bacterium]